MKFPIDDIRAQFPALSLRDEDVVRTYLDNPAGTQVPKRVIEGVTDVIINANSNSGMFNRTSVDIDARIHHLYQSCAIFFGADDPGEIIIGPNMTTLTYHLSRCLGADFKAGDEIILTRMDHEGNVAPWLQLAEDLDLVIKWLPVNLDTWRVEPEALSEALSDRTKLLAINYASNLTGSINDVKQLTKIAKNAGVIVYVDGVQYAPHLAIDVKDLGCDFFLTSSYKFFGPHLGVGYGRREILESIRAYKTRTAYNCLPDRMITGTQQMELFGGLQATLDYFVDFGKAIDPSADTRGSLVAAFQTFSEYEDHLAKRMIDGLSNLKGVTLQGPPANENAGIRVPSISFSHKLKASRDIAKALSAANIYCHWGNNYALELTRSIGLDVDDGPVRVGIAHYNTEAEVDRTLAQLDRILG